MDPLRHPDLTRLGRRLRDQFDDTLEAEQDAARIVARRRRSLRDILLDAEDRKVPTSVRSVDGQLLRGPITAVGTDHLIIEVDGREQAIALAHVVSVKVG